MKYNCSKNYYEEIGPPQQKTGVQKCLYQTAIALGIGILMVVVVLNTFSSPEQKSHELSASAPEDAENSDGENIIELSQGKIRGKRMTSRAGREYLAFLGIPYAKPPVGTLRFQPPVKAEPWNGTLDGTILPSLCVQHDKYNPNPGELRSIGSEDCLYLNVFTPKNMTTLKKRFDVQKFPVMVYIHGGNMYGDVNRFGADYFMDEDTVLVMFHYRIGVLGYLNTNDKEARGNQGMKDQVMALQWVQDNIAKFGGSRRKVAVFGNSFGGIHISSHMLSSMSTGLFQRAICQSGTLIVPGVFMQDPIKLATDLGNKLNCSQALVECFQNTDAHELILNSYTMWFLTSVEPPAEKDVFLSDTPITLLTTGQMNPVSSIFGAQSGEGLANSLSVLMSPNLTETLNENWTPAAFPLLELDNSPTIEDSEKIRIANEIRDFYLGSNDLSREVETNFTAMFSDRRFFHPTNVFAQYQLDSRGRGRSRGGRNNVYLYYFNEEAEKSYGDAIVDAYGSTEFLGAGHADDLQFMFPYAAMPSIPMGSKHANFSRMMIRLWVSFANTGKPTGVDNGVEWLPIEQEKPYQWFELSSQPKMIDILGDRMDFWDSFSLTDLYV